MFFDHTTLSYIFIGSAIFSLSLSILAFSNKNNSANKSLGLLLVATSIWSFFYGLELMAHQSKFIYAFITLQYVGIATIPIFLLIFASHYAEKDSWINFKNIISISLVPCITFSMVATNHWHHLFYKTSELITINDLTYHAFTKGVFYFLHLTFSYSFVLVAIYILVSTYFRVSRENKARVLLILVSTLIPYVFSLLYVVGIAPEGNIDLTPFGFLLMGLLVIIGTFNAGLLDIKPVVLNALFSSISDAILVVDLNGVITSSNPKAIELIETAVLPPAQIDFLIHSQNYMLHKYDSAQYMEIDAENKTFRVEKTPITNHRHQTIAYMFLIVDITQEKLIQHALKHSEEKYRVLFDNAQEGIAVIQLMKFVFFNPMLLKMTGYDKQSLQDINYTNLIYPADLPFVEQAYGAVAAGQQSDNKLQFRLQTKNGDLCWIELSVILIEWNNQLAGLLFINNINEQKQAEQLKELLISISNTYINAPIDKFDSTINASLREMGEFVHADRSYIFEYDWDKNISNNTFEWCAEGISAEIQNLQQIPLDVMPVLVDAHRNNKPLYINNVMELEPDDDLRKILEPQGILSLITIPMIHEGLCVGFVGFDAVRVPHIFSDKERMLLEVFSQMIVNLSNRKRTNDLIHQQIAEQYLVNTISSEFVSADHKNIDAKIQHMLQQTGEFFKVDRSYILRYSDDLTIETNTHEWCAADVVSEMKNINHVDINIFPWWKDQIDKKEIIYIHNSNALPEHAAIEKAEFLRQGIKTLLCFPIVNNNTLIGYFGFDDVQRVRTWDSNHIRLIEILSNIVGDALIKAETEIELIRSKELAEAASVAKSNFLSNMSHEIRTPLNGVIGFTELLRNTVLNKTQKDYLDNAITSANSLLGVISDILDFSKIESGKMELETIKTDIIQLFENATDIIKVHAANKGLELLLNINPEIPRFAFIDPIRTKQILVNLLSNAVKFTHIGEIELCLDFELIDNHSGMFKVRVRDTGIGIKDDQRNKLFKAFSQADTSTTRRYGGTGLGLIISNSLAQKMGGSIGFQSEYGKGTTFSFNITCDYACGERLDYKNIKKISRVLVVDDNANNRSILENTLKYWKIQFQGAESGAQALQLIAQDEKFDLIIMDYHMPEMDGLETIARIRETMKDFACQPIIMLHSSSDDMTLHEKSKALKVRFLLTKPVKQDELYFYLNSVQCDDSVNESLLSDTQSEQIQPELLKTKAYNILVAEDTPMNMLVIGNMLRSFLPNFNLFEAHNGIEAIQQMKLLEPDVVLMDVQMPELDGLEATKQIRRLKNGRVVPVIALTAGVSKEERELCFKSGMDDFISKPIERIELKRIVEKYLFDSKQVKQVESAAEKADDYQIPAVSRHFNREQLLSKIGSEDILKSLLDMARLEYPKYIAEIADAIVHTDEKEIKQKAHKLKGSALNMEFVGMGELAKAIEMDAGNPKALNALMQQLELEWNELISLF
ncbi:MAG: hypothetical protein AUK44_09535 [Porphyromonadaceae bacterium CG2_30_38_12]|nr:MAG: hypothetical protein AUK44_09535 [Porphyromonadaceae bacterium CG2_30_38_12]